MVGTDCWLMYIEYSGFYSTNILEKSVVFQPNQQCSGSYKGRQVVWSELLWCSADEDCKEDVLFLVSHVLYVLLYHIDHYYG